MRQFSTAARNSLFHLGGARYWRLPLLAALLLAAAAFGGVFSAVAQAQDANGAITGLTLSSDSPGTLTVSWDMPSPTPTNYRVDWAKSAEDYQSWRVDEGHVYPEGTATTAAISGLEGGEEYKVRMRARYHDGEHADSPWSGPWSEETRTVAAEPEPDPTEEPTPEPTEEPTPEPGAIGSATAAADDPQTLVITWEEPADPHDNPTDYRVNWARSEDEYPSYTEEHGNAHPATPAHTLEGLDHNTEYKIRIRARYSPNDQYDEHWSGPWIELTVRTMSEPGETTHVPGKPNLVGTAVTPEGHVSLLWQDPEDDTITGYRVLRGPDADSLAVIREDTGSSAISYTDTEAEAGQTHTYAVEARSAAGLGPMSNTRTATVPASEEKEEPVALRQETVTTLVSNLNNASDSSGLLLALKRWATSFTTDDDAVSHTLTSLQLRAGRFRVGSTSSNPMVAVHRDNGGQPGDLLYTLDKPDDFLSVNDTTYRTYTFSAPEGAVLGAGETYWIVHGAPSVRYRLDTTDETSQTPDGWMIGDTSLAETAVQNMWENTPTGPLKFAVIGSTASLDGKRLVSNLNNASDSSGLLLALKRWATSFTTDDDAVSHTLTSLQLRAGRFRVGSTSSNPMVAVHRDNGGQPGDLLYTLDKPDDFLSVNDTTYRTYTFSAPEGAVLGAGETYWIVHGAPSVRYRLDTTDETSQTPDGWMIGDTSLAETAVQNMWENTPTGPLKFAVIGSTASLDGKRLVSNLNNASDSSGLLLALKRWATSFTTDDDAVSHTLTSLQLRAGRFRVGSTSSNPMVAVHRDNGGQPGDLLYTLDKPDDFLSVNDTTYRTYTFSAPEGAVLGAGETYWIVHGAPSVRYRLDTTDETSQTPDGWMIGDTSLAETAVQNMWENTPTGPLKFAVIGSTASLDGKRLVSNLNNASDSSGLLLALKRWATSFTTDDDAVSHTLTSLQLRAGRFRVGSTSSNPMVAVHRDNGGQPGDLLYTLDKPDDFLSVNDTTYRTYTFSAPEGAVLGAGETYWIVHGAPSVRYRLDTTDETSQTPDGWMIGDTSLAETAVQNTWENTPTGPLKFAVIGSTASAFEEEPDVDLPGGPGDCHLTDRIVLAGQTSSGHLTTGIDTDSGLTGDCFRLETRLGKQYRVEVKFGDTESVDIGGSVWIVYTGSDFSGMSSLGSAVDHNREDGRSFTDFKHIHNGVKSYFVDVAAYDLYSTPYSTNSLTYNGPYTITMTDITGVQRMVTNIDPTLGSPVDYETGLSLSDGDTITLAAPFITGDHPEGYALDRIRVPFDDIAADEASPLISIYSNSSDTPSAKLCDLDRPAQIVESAVTWSGFPPPFTFLADDCAYNTLAASTPYWVVFTGVNPADYTLEMTTSAEEHDYYDTGWTMDNFLARSTDGGASWTVTAANAGNIRIEFWAKPKTNSATGEPLARGQRFLPGQELTAGPGTVSDPDGTSRANYRYQWRRTDDQGVSTVIEGATGASYIITDDDRGHRVGVIVSFLDDAGNEESRASMATSYVPGQTRILIKKSGGTNNRAHGTVGLSSGFYTAAGDLKHRIESVTQILTAAGIGNINTDLFRFRLFTSNDASNPLDRKPAVEIATFTNPARVATGQKKFTAPTDALLAGGTTYHIVMYTGGAGEIGCEQLGSSQAHDGSLPNWELIQRTYPLTSENTAGSAYFGDPCNMRIDGYQLADAPHITSLEITSTPNTSPSYETGETISVTATLSEAVNFTGPEPVLPIRIGDNTREAIYDAGSSTTTQWVFQYIVLEEDRDDDGISVEQHALRAYADADLSHNAISTAPSHRVNARSLLRSVRVTSKPEAPNWYGPGETIQFTAEFTLPVTVTGDPEFAFSITSGGSTHARATYIGTTENRIVFEYTISTTDDDSDGIWIGDHTDTLRLDGDDAIVGVSNGRTAVLDHPEIGRLASHRIDQNPRIVTVAVTSDPTHGTNSDIYAPGEVIEFTATFNQEVNVVGDPEFEFSIDSGSADERAAYHSGSGTKAIVFRYTIVAADIDPSGIWIGDQTRTFKLDADDSIRGVSNSLDAVLDHRGLGILTGHKIDNMITP